MVSFSASDWSNYDFQDVGLRCDQAFGFDLHSDIESTLQVPMSSNYPDSFDVLTIPLKLPGLLSVYHGKVRDVYDLGTKLVMVTSNRISAFDVILQRPIPGKGQVLNQLASYFLTATEDIVPNWLEAVPVPFVSIGKKCKPYAVEMVIRGYLVGHAWRQYAAGHRSLCGVPLPEGLKENDQLPNPIITPTTKASEGHDQDISREEIIAQGIVSEEVYVQLEAYTQALYQRGVQMATKRGLILVDTKYEFGDYNGKVMLMDEIHTPDSSRYFYAEGYEERQAAGQEQKQLSKEFVRRWLIDNGFQGHEGQTVPIMTDEWLEEISARYKELYELVTGTKFIPYLYHQDPQWEAARIEQAILPYI